MLSAHQFLRKYCALRIRQCSFAGSASQVDIEYNNEADMPYFHLIATNMPEKNFGNFEYNGLIVLRKRETNECGVK